MSASPLREGDVVWAHQRGYPWWPAVISNSPANPNQGLWQVGVGKIRYHCTFLAWNRERSWLDRTAFKKFKREDGGDGRKKEYLVKGRDYKDSHREAIELALKIPCFLYWGFAGLAGSNFCIFPTFISMKDMYKI